MANFAVGRSNGVLGRTGVIPAFYLYGEALRPPDERLIHVETIAARSALHNWTIRAHRHRDLNQLLLIFDGRVAAKLDATDRFLQAPAFVAVPPGVVHSFTFQPATGGLVISFASGLMREMGLAGSRIAEVIERPVAQTVERRVVSETDLHSLGDMLLREFRCSAAGRHAALRGLLGATLVNVLRLAHQPESAESDSSASERELVALFRRLVEFRYRTHAGIATFAAELGVSETKLRRACAHVTGQSPVELLHLRLLVEAERQLRYTTLTIAQIAYQLGFEDPAYFTRFFTRGARLSPRAFRAAYGSDS